MLKRLWNSLWKTIHQSWCVVWLCIGIIGGVVLGLIFNFNYLNSFWFLMIVGILFVFSLL